MNRDEPGVFGPAECAQWREALSARLDGAAGDEPGLDAHLVSCSACRQFAAAAADVPRQTRRASRPADGDIDGDGDFPARMVRESRRHDRLTAGIAARAGLVVVAAQVLALAVPALLGQGDGASTHIARHVGSFEVAFAIGFLVVAVRPARARGLLPMMGALGVALAITGAVDIADHHVPFGGEMLHLPEIAGLGLVWFVARRTRTAVKEDRFAREGPGVHVVQQVIGTHQQES